MAIYVFPLLCLSLYMIIFYTFISICLTDAYLTAPPPIEKYTLEEMNLRAVALDIVFVLVERPGITITKKVGIAF